MPRLHHTETGLDVGMFSVYQMHPEVALRLGSSAAVGGLAVHDMSLQSIITKHQTGLVIVRAEAEYVSPLTFFSGPSITTEAGVRLREDGRLLIFDMRHRLDGADVIVMRVCARPIKLTGSPALDAIPGPVDDEVRAMFAADEIVPDKAVPARELKALVRRWVADAEKIGEARGSFSIGRADCEIADQWWYGRVASFVAATREQAAFASSGALSACLGKPIALFKAEFFRPMYLGDSGQVELSAYRRGEEMFFVHRVLGAEVPGGKGGDRPLCALAVEVF